MTAHITKLFRIALVTLTTFPLALSLNLSPTRAELAPGALGDVTNVNTSLAQSLPSAIALNPLRRTPVEVTPLDNPDTDNPDTDATAVREKSMAHVESGYKSEQAGNQEQALYSYYTAMTIDPTNGYAFLLAGRLIGNNQTGIQCLRVAAQLFEQQQDNQGYKIAVELLQSDNNS
jgi:hypothetical protein